MPQARFTDVELAAFQAKFCAASTWRTWSRRDGLSGQDVLEVAISGRATPIKIAKSETGFAATGFDGWGLVICESLDELLETLVSFQPRVNAAQHPSMHKQAA